MDDIDRAILRELQVHGRIPYADLGPKVGLSPSAARLRLQRLIDAKAVQVVGVTDPMTMGRQTMALLGLRIDGDSRKVADERSRHDEVVYTVLTAGGFDLFAEVVCLSLKIFWASSTTSCGPSRVSHPWRTSPGDRTRERDLLDRRDAATTGRARRS